jgi:hypothetical protein
MRRDGEVNLKPPGMGLKPLQLLIECPKTADESLVAVTWGFGEEERLEGRQVFGEEIILREPASERLHWECARGQRLEKRSAGCLIPQRPGVFNERMTGQRSFGGSWWFRQFVGR